MFNDKYSLTQAVLDGRKTMTRRIAIPAAEREITLCNLNKDWYEDEESNVYIPKYQVGEVIAVAQSYMDVDQFHRKGKNAAYLNYLDSMLSDMKKLPGWHNKMFVKADLMPHHIEITGIKVERLQDISEEDCLKEGVELNSRQYEYDGTKLYCVRGLGHWRDIGCTNFDTPREAFASLIDKVAGKGTWSSNPYVFCYSFELIEK